MIITLFNLAQDGKTNKRVSPIRCKWPSSLKSSRMLILALIAVSTDFGQHFLGVLPQ